MSLRLHCLCVWFLIGTVSCLNASSPDRPSSTDTDGWAGLQQKEGVAGRISDEKGNPVSGASVLAAPSEPNEPAVPEMAIVSDANGRYRWSLRAGRYDITVIAEGYERASKRVTVNAANVATLDFRLSRSR